MLDACADMHGVCQLGMSTRMTSTLAQVLLAVADQGNHTALTCLKELLTRTEWYAREAAIACIKKLCVACSCDIFDELGPSCRCSIVPTMIELTQGDYAIVFPNVNAGGGLHVSRRHLPAWPEVFAKCVPWPGSLY
jgi:hypothetical protein